MCSLVRMMDVSVVWKELSTGLLICHQHIWSINGPQRQEAKTLVAKYNGNVANNRFGLLLFAY